MLAVRKHHGVAAGRPRPPQPFEREIDRLGAAAGEDDLDRFAAQAPGDRLARVFEQSPRGLARPVYRRGVPHLRRRGDPRVARRDAQRGRGRVIEVDHPHYCRAHGQPDAARIRVLPEPRLRRSRRDPRSHRRHPACLVERRLERRTRGVRRHRPRLDHRDRAARARRRRRLAGDDRRAASRHAVRTARRRSGRPAQHLQQRVAPDRPLRARPRAGASWRMARRRRRRNTRRAGRPAPEHAARPHRDLRSARHGPHQETSGCSGGPPRHVRGPRAPRHDRAPHHARRDRRRAAADPRVRDRAAPAHPGAQELLGLQHRGLLRPALGLRHAGGARSRAAGGAARSAADGARPARRGHRGHPRRRLQPHRRAQHRRPAIELPRHRQRRLLPPARRRQLHRCDRLRKLGGRASSSTRSSTGRTPSASTGSASTSPRRSGAGPTTRSTRTIPCCGRSSKTRVWRA